MIRGSSQRPRLAIFRSLRFIYLQAIDDEKGHTLAQASDKNPDRVGAKVAKNLLAQKIKQAVFDRAGYRYHGKVKQTAEALRKAGLNF